MSQDNPPISTNEEKVTTSFKPVRLVFVVLLIMLVISQAIKWYSHSVTLPRFCEDPELALHHLEEIVTQRSPAGEQSKKPYIIAAKLIFLIPRQSDEPVQDYIHRVRTQLSQQCMN